MAIEGMRFQGQSVARVVCDCCGRDEVVPCAYEGKRKAESPGRPKESQARAKAITMGWSSIKNKLRCPACEAKRKVHNVKPNLPEAPREPTKRQRIEIITMLSEVYDLDAECYSGGETDQSVADALEVLPGWVAQIRGAEFGPDGANEEIHLLSEKIADLEQALPEAIRAMETSLQIAQKRCAEVSSLRVTLDKIKKAVGPHARAKAGVN